VRDTLRHHCPLCGREIETTYERHSIPYFSDILLVYTQCPCGYRHADVIILGEGDPSRWELRVESVEDLSARVVRSTTGTVEIPEHELMIEPGPACQGFITNVEGVLNRFSDAVKTAMTALDDRKEMARAEEILEWLRRAREGEEQFTLIIEDPAGNSAIITPKAKKTILSETR